MALAAGAAISAVALLALSIGLGWWGPDVGRGAEFCEAAREGWLRQPANSWSNAGFVIAGLLIAWRCGDREQLGLFPAGLATMYAMVVVLLGPGSAAMHGTQTAFGGLMDQTSMYLLAAFAAAYALKRWTRQGLLAFVQLYALLVAACELAGSVGALPLLGNTGNAAFGLLLVLAVIVEALIWRRGETVLNLTPGLSALGVMLTASTIWSLTQSRWCDPGSLIQGHALWHLLCAVAAYLLFRYYAAEQIPSAN